MFRNVFRVPNDDDSDHDNGPDDIKGEHIKFLIMRLKHSTNCWKMLSKRYIQDVECPLNFPSLFAYFILSALMD